MDRTEAINLLEKHGSVRLCFFSNPYLLVMAAYPNIGQEERDRITTKVHREFYKALGIPEWVRKAIYDSAGAHNITGDVKLDWIALIEEYQPDIVSILLETVCDSSGSSTIGSRSRSPSPRSPRHMLGSTACSSSTSRPGRSPRVI